MKKITFIIVLLGVVLAAGAQKRDKAVVKLEKQLVGKFVEIPATHYSIFIEDENGKKQSSKEITTAGFYMLETEVPYASYKTFLEDLKAQGRMEDYEKASIQDTALDKINQKYKDWGAPDLSKYPVANISYEGALLFCQWLTEKVGDPAWEYTLPSKVQWQVAAQGGNFLASYSDGAPGYGPKEYTYFQIRDKYLTKKEDGYHTVLFQEPQPYQIQYVNLSKPEELQVVVRPSTTPVVSYDKNPFGLYNMCGNVAEMVYGENVALGGSWADPGFDIRIQSEKSYTGPSPMIGFRVIAVRK